MVDGQGVYYDAHRPSAVEAAIAQGVSGAQAARAARLITQWREGGLSKYNHAPDYTGPLPARYVLVADQCRGDMSIAGGLAGPENFAAMLGAALAENPDATIVVKAHPDTFSHGRASCFGPAMLAHPRIMVIAQACHPLRLIREAQAVYTVTSQIGFEALLHGVPVRCFGMPFYAGWGLSRDEQPAPARRGTASLAALAHGAFVAHARYADPASGLAWSPEQAFAHAAQRLVTMRSQRLAAMLTAPWLCASPAPSSLPPYAPAVWTPPAWGQRNSRPSARPLATPATAPALACLALACPVPAAAMAPSATPHRPELASPMPGTAPLRAFLTTQATACEDSSAGMMPSV